MIRCEIKHRKHFEGTADCFCLPLGVTVSALCVQDAIEILGQGRFGMVVKAKFRGTTVVVKRAIPPKAATRTPAEANRASADGMDSQPPLFYDSFKSFSLENMSRLIVPSDAGSDKYDLAARSPLMRQLTFSNKGVKQTADADLKGPKYGWESTAKDREDPNFVLSKSDVTIDMVRCLLRRWDPLPRILFEFCPAATLRCATPLQNLS